MPVSEKVYPEWVQAQRTKGTTVKKNGDTYYLYKRTSKRVPGKKYPQPVDTYIGIITPDGIITTNKKKVSLTDIEVWEYGFSKAVWDLCPADWKKPLGADWEDILKIIILKWSANSYLGQSGKLRPEEDFHCHFPAQSSSLSRRIYKTFGVGIEDLFPLKTVFLVSMEKENVISKIHAEHKKLIDQLGLELEVR